MQPAQASSQTRLRQLFRAQPIALNREEEIYERYVGARHLAMARKKSLRFAIDLGEVLFADGKLTEEQHLEALAEVHRTEVINLDEHPAFPRLKNALPAQLCQRYNAVPWRQYGEVLLVATSRPWLADKLREELPKDAPEIVALVCSEAQIMRAIIRVHGRNIAGEAMMGLPARESARWRRSFAQSRRLKAAIAAILLAAFAIVAPSVWLAALSIMSLGIVSIYDFGELISRYRARRNQEKPSPAASLSSPWSRVSLIIPALSDNLPLAHITAAADQTYPKSLLDVFIIIQSGDHKKRAALAARYLPSNFRVIELPTGRVLNTPFALNFALGFCRGAYVCVLDGHYTVSSDLIDRSVARMNASDADIAGLQGVLTPERDSKRRHQERKIVSKHQPFGLPNPHHRAPLFLRRRLLRGLNGWDSFNAAAYSELGLRLARCHLRIETIYAGTLNDPPGGIFQKVTQRALEFRELWQCYRVNMRNFKEMYRTLGPSGLFMMHSSFLAEGLRHIAMIILIALPICLFLFAGEQHALFATTMVMLMASLLSKFGKFLLLHVFWRSRDEKYRLGTPKRVAEIAINTCGVFRAIFEFVWRKSQWDPRLQPTRPSNIHDIRARSPLGLRSSITERIN